MKKLFFLMFMIIATTNFIQSMNNKIGQQVCHKLSGLLKSTAVTLPTLTPPKTKAIEKEIIPFQPAQIITETESYDRRTAVLYMLRETNESLMSRAKLCLNHSQTVLQQQHYDFSYEEKLAALEKDLSSFLSKITFRSSMPWNSSSNMQPLKQDLCKAHTNIKWLLEQYILQRLRKFEDNYTTLLNKNIYSFAGDKEQMHIILREKSSIALDLKNFKEVALKYQKECSNKNNPEFNKTNKNISTLNNQATFLTIMFHYSAFILDSDKNNIVEQVTKNIGSDSLFPLIEFMNQLDSDITKLNTMNTNQNLPIPIPTNLLSDIKNLLNNSQLYQQEVRFYKIYLHQKNEIEEANRRALAAQRSADTAQIMSFLAITKDHSSY